MNKVMRESGTLMFFGMSMLVGILIFSYVAPAYLIKQYEPFESLAQLEYGSTLHVKCKFENTKTKFDFSEETMGFSKYPYHRYYLQIVETEGKNIAVLAPKRFSSASFVGRVIARDKNESIRSILDKYETGHAGFRFENGVIVAERTSAMKKVGIISNVLYGIAFMLGIVLWMKLKRHYLL